MSTVFCTGRRSVPGGITLPAGGGTVERQKAKRASADRPPSRYSSSPAFASSVSPSASASSASSSSLASRSRSADRLDLVGWSLLVLLVVDRDRGDANALGRQLAVVGLREGVERERDRLVGREALLVLLLQIVAEVAPVGADRERLPLVGRAGRVGLEQARLAVLDPPTISATPKGRAADLRVLLDVVGDVLGERLDTDRLAVAQAVDLRLSAGEVDQLAGVGDVARRSRRRRGRRPCGVSRYSPAPSAGIGRACPPRGRRRPRRGRRRLPSRVSPPPGRTRPGRACRRERRW